MTLENPLQLLGKTSSKASLYFLNIAFTVMQKFTQQKKLQQLQNRTYLKNRAKLHLGFHAHKTKKLQQKLQPSKLYE